MNGEDINWNTSLITSLYSQVEFLKTDIKEKNDTIAKLLYLLKESQIKHNYTNDHLSILNSTGSVELDESEPDNSNHTDSRNSTIITDLKFVTYPCSQVGLNATLGTIMQNRP